MSLLPLICKSIISVLYDKAALSPFEKKGRRKKDGSIAAKKSALRLKRIENKGIICFYSSLDVY